LSLNPLTALSAAEAAAERRDVLELYLGETRQLFNSMDPAPFRERDIDPAAAQYILDWAYEVSRRRPLGLVVHLGRENTSGDSTTIVTQAVHEYFRGRAEASRKELKKLFHNGRITLVIALVFLSLANGFSEFVSELIPHEGLFWLITESLLIAATVALCQPIAIFLYDWWPIRADARLYDRLSVMDVQVFCANTASASVVQQPAL
jgi:hypothetical protein